MQVFSIGAFGWRPLAFLLGFVVVLPVALTLVALWASHSRHYFFAGFVLAITVPLALALTAQLGAARLRIDGDRLIVGGGLYQETLRLSAIDVGAARRVPASEVGRVLGVRTNGVGLPGLSLGWFRVGTAKKVFAAAGNGDALYLPTTESFDLVVSPTDSAAFLSALRES